MTKQLIRVHNTETNEVIDREMNKEELAQWESNQASFAAVQAEEETKETAKAILLAKLGITAEEAKLLLS